VQYVDLIVPTRNRAAKLERMLRSVPESACGKSIRITIICDADPVTAARYGARVHRVILIPNRVGSVAARNQITPDAEDAVLMAPDDVIFEAGAIDAAVLAMEEFFPDGDGVVGFVQTNHKSYSATGVCLVGQKFLQRYPGKQLYFPGYFHFACQEIERLASSLGKIHVEPEARLFHAHPSTGHGKMDRTHIEARIHKAADQMLSKARREAGLTWGAA
jgi:glycosyltransferase involved in cell wall biosynthesis